MIQLRSVVLLVVALAVAGCANRNAANSGAGTDFSVPPPASSGGSSDPSSPQYFSQTIGDRVLFEVDQFTLTSSARQVLDGQAQWLMTNSNYTAVIEGHADEQGTREYNLALGSRRANAVREYLVTRGVPSGRLQTVTFGKERPIAICSDESCYSQNRRAVTVIATGALS
jgi:peptidoglycan-associated lipoprotein